MTQRIRRIRVAPEATKERESKARNILQSIADIDSEKATIDARRAELVEQLEEEMRRVKALSVTEGMATAAFVRPSGKSVVTIDPRKFEESVDDDEFYSCITVSVTKAKQVLSQKALNRISSVAPAKLGEETLKITYAKK